MKKNYILLITLGTAFQCMAQSFVSQPNNLLIQEVNFDLANSAYIYFDDLTTDTLQLEWRIGDISVPEGWDIDVCDYGACYEGIPTGIKTMVAAEDTIRPYLKLIIQPGQTPGLAWLWFRANKYGDPTDFQDVYFSLNTPGTVGTQTSALAANEVNVWPNPAQDWITLESAIPVAGTMYDALGRTIWAGNINGQTRINIQNWATGMYWLRTGNSIQQLIVK